ncbi:hypothetical protein BH23GEM8_BH23GEM8_16170 [soil metagenome]
MAQAVVHSEHSTPVLTGADAMFSASANEAIGYRGGFVLTVSRFDN